MEESKPCSKCHEIKPLDKFYFRSNGKLSGRCNDCKNAYQRAYYKRNHDHVHGMQLAYYHAIGHQRPMETTKDCTAYLGIHIAERVLSKFFDHITVMPRNNPGFDYICGKGFKIDVKSGCLQVRKGRGKGWQFNIDGNKIADYFLCLAFDDRNNLEPQHVWLIPGSIVNHCHNSMYVADSAIGLAKWSKYERPLERVLECCETIREGAKS